MVSSYLFIQARFSVKLKFFLGSQELSAAVFLPPPPHADLLLLGAFISFCWLFSNSQVDRLVHDEKGPIAACSKHDLQPRSATWRHTQPWSR